MAQKSIVVGGFSQEQRKTELEKVKAKYEKKGYKFLKFVDNGVLKSVAIFEVDEAILRKEKSAQLIVAGIGFMVIAAILYFKSNS